MAKTKRKTSPQTKAKAKGKDAAKTGGEARALPVAQRVRELAPAVLVCALVLFQGGYYPGATCVIGLVSAVAYIVALVACRVSARTGRDGAVAGGLIQPAVFLFAVAVVYLASSLSHGAAATMLLETGSWFALAGMALWCVQDSALSRIRMLEALAVCGAALAALGILMFAGIVPLEGGVNAGRLMFTFQYANSAGLFFAVVTVLCLTSAKQRTKYLAVLPTVALLMTQSAGALIVFALAMVALGVRFARGAKPDARLVVAAGVVIAALLAAGIFMFQGRWQQAAQTFVERIVQVLDGLSVLGGNALFGIGPDCWQFEYGLHQTAQYRAASVHCSYVQMALDAGLLAALAIAVMIVVGIVILVRRRDFPGVVCALMVAIHALVDFDFQFSSIVLLLSAVLCAPRMRKDFGAVDVKCEEDGGGVRDAGQEAKEASLARIGSVFGWAIVVCSLAACAGSIYLDMRMGEVQVACAQGDVAGAYARADEDLFLADDPAIASQLVVASFAQEDYATVLKRTEGRESGYAAYGLYRAISLDEAGMADEARRTLEQTLHDYPYDPDLYDAVRSYIEQRHPEREYISLYNEQAGRANALSTQGHAAWLSNQKAVDLIDG